MNNASFYCLINDNKCYCDVSMTSAILYNAYNTVLISTDHPDLKAGVR